VLRRAAAAAAQVLAGYCSGQITVQATWTAVANSTSVNGSLPLAVTDVTSLDVASYIYPDATSPPTHAAAVLHPMDCTGAYRWAQLAVTATLGQARAPLPAPPLAGRGHLSCCAPAQRLGGR